MTQAEVCMEIICGFCLDSKHDINYLALSGMLGKRKAISLHSFFPQSRSTVTLIRKNVLKVKFGIFIGVNKERVLL